MTKINSFQDLVGDAFYHGLGHTFGVGNQLVKYRAITIFKDQVQLLLPSGLEHFDQVNKILVL
jgi:hypothetical protein